MTKKGGDVMIGGERMRLVAVMDKRDEDTNKFISLPYRK